MSVVKIKSVIKTFILNNRNDLLTIKGDWGVGKTFFWRKTVEECSSKNEIGHKNYSYVSLFGIDSFETLKNTIVTNQILSTAVGKDFNLSASVAFSKLIKPLKHIEKSPIIRNYSGGIGSELAFQLVRDSLICFDDLERRSGNFDIRDILGLACFLKEQRNCKVVFILNDEKLLNKETFDENNEKVVDIEVKFAPLPEEVFDYVFKSEHPHFDLIQKCCAILKIKNIRILQRINYYIENLLPYLAGVQESVIRDAIRSTILFVWCHYNKNGDSPPLAFIEEYSHFGIIFQKQVGEKPSDETLNWNSVLAQYSYRHTDEVDKLLMAFVKNGYLDEPEFQNKIFDKNQEINRQQGVNQYQSAWDLYNRSFKNNSQEFVEKLYKGFLANMKHLTVRNLDETVSVMRELKADEKANILTDKFVETRFDETQMFLKRRNHLDYNVKDNYLNQQLDNKIEQSLTKQNLREILENFSSNNLSYYEDLEFLSNISAGEFYSYFISYEPYEDDNEKKYRHDLYSQIIMILDFAKAPSEPYKTIGSNLRTALIKIAKSNQMNRIRILNWFKSAISEDDLLEPE